MQSMQKQRAARAVHFVFGSAWSKGGLLVAAPGDTGRPSCRPLLGGSQPARRRGACARASPCHRAAAACAGPWILQAHSKPEKGFNVRISGLVFPQRASVRLGQTPGQNYGTGPNDVPGQNDSHTLLWASAIKLSSTCALSATASC